jgi:hypothetical protein
LPGELSPRVERGEWSSFFEHNATPELSGVAFLFTRSGIIN